MPEQITLESLASKVREMRTAQNHYFHRRAGLQKAKDLETMVDKLLEQIPEPTKVEQRDIFNQLNQS